MTRTERLKQALKEIEVAKQDIELILACTPEDPITPKSRLLIDKVRENLRVAKSNVRYTHN